MLASMASLSPLPKIFSQNPHVHANLHDHLHNPNVIYRNLSFSGLGFRGSQNASLGETRIVRKSSNQTEVMIGEFSTSLYSFIYKGVRTEDSH